MNIKIKEGISAGLMIFVLVGLLITGLGHLLSPVGGIWNSSNQAYYPEYMEIHDSSLTAQVTVYRDLMGIPHIFVESEADFAFAIGYVQAQDRLFMMDIMRRFVKGTISEVMGPGLLGTDQNNRFLGFTRLGRAMWAALLNHSDPEAANIASLIQRYCDGVNRYIQD
ncbi:MAG: penicillin acylase family protein, partial [Candidatus Helarchaeota archaeon]|nr:penicillin acylase family protein [Candidatus Helarchaeota archaeon]